MTAYELHLLGLAVENCAALGFRRCEGSWEVWSGDRSLVFTGPTLADALAALLTDLGVEVPARPSAEHVAETAAFHFHEEVIDELRALYDRDRLTAIAILEGGDS